MFDIGWTEIALIGIVALIIIGPKDLPRVLRTLGQWTAKARALSRDLRNHVDDLIREAELDEVKHEFDSVRSGNIGEYVENTIDPNREMRKAFELDDDDDELERSAAENTLELPPDDRDLFNEGAEEPADASSPESEETVAADQAVAAEPVADTAGETPAEPEDKPKP